MQLAVYKAKGTILDALIRWWTGSSYSHCELVINGMAYSSSARDRGVRHKKIVFNPDHWDFIDIPWAKVEDVLAYFDRTEGEPYGWSDIIARQVFNRPGNSSGQFCSEWCAAALVLFAPTVFSPETLASYCRMQLGVYNGS